MSGSLPEMPQLPIRRRKLSEQLVSRIEAMIQDGTFARGSLLPAERELMRLFGVGRASIREALFALGRMGLVEIRNGARPLVGVPGPNTMLTDLAGIARSFLSEASGPQHFREARAVLESGIASIAAQRGTASDLVQLRAAFDANAAAVADKQRFERTDVAFHYALAAMTRNPIFTSVHDALADWLTGQRTQALRAAGAERIALEGHKRILQAVERGQPVAAAAAMARHLREINDLIGPSD